MDLLLTGRLLSAEEAHRFGLVNEIVQPDQLAARVEALADTLLANSPQAVTATKRLIATQNKEWLSAAIVDGIEASVTARTTADFSEGVAAFLEKRKPLWPK